VARFALRPWWIVSHLIVVGLVVAFVSLGFWQLRRLDEVQAQNARIAVRLAEPEVQLARLLPPDAADADIEAVVDRPVETQGRYRAEDQVLIRGRSLDGAPGSWVVVPLELADGRVVAVNRGWIRNDGRYIAVPDTYRVPSGEVTVNGLLQPSQERGSLGATDPPDGRLRSLARVDLDRLDQQVAGDVVPAWLQMTDLEPEAPDPSPRPLDPPEVGDEGPHLSYAGQWFTFATIGAVGYPFILRRASRERAGDGAADRRPGPDDPDPDDRPEPGDPRLDATVEP